MLAGWLLLGVAVAGPPREQPPPPAPSNAGTAEPVRVLPPEAVAYPLELVDDIATVFALPPIAGERRTTADTLDLGHGRIEQRWLQTSSVWVGDSDWPGLAQVFRLERQVIIKKTGVVREEVVAGVTSLAPERADAVRLLALVGGQWQIENQSHWGRDVTFDEDRSQVRCSNIPQVMTALRHTVIGLMRCAGYLNIAAACRRFAAQTTAALHLIGITLEN
jgi:hypothetical protein